MSMCMHSLVSPAHHSHSPVDNLLLHMSSLLQRLLRGEGTFLSPDPSLQDVPQYRQPILPGLSLQSLVAHRVPLKPYAAPVPRSQSLQDQPTRNLAAFPASHDPDPAAVPTPTATPSARGAVIRQNSDPTSEGPGPSPNPPSWVRPDNEAPPKVSTTLKDKKIEFRVGRKKARQPCKG